MSSTSRPLGRAWARVDAAATGSAAPDPARLAGAPAPVAVLALNRLGYGPRQGDVAAFNALGATDAARVAAYVGQQIWPGSDAQDTEYWNRRTGAAPHPNPGFTTLAKSLTQLWVDHRVNGQQPSRPVEEVVLDTLMRRCWSRWQLREVLVDFWMNHFNVYGFETYTRETFVHWNRDVIRANVFGNFRTLLEGVARSTTMLYYLDNYTNTRSGPNENWARELFELHTLGAENYYGVGAQSDVPMDGTWPPGLPGAGNPMPVGYVDADVYEAARCFTGWGVDGPTGLFEYTDSNHDRFQKSILNGGLVNIPADQAPEQDGLDVLDLLAAHPGTARHLARKLCRRFVADDPAESLVEDVADFFNANWQTPDQLRQVYAVLLNRPEFLESWGGKVKRPVEVALSAIRAGNGQFFFGYTSQNPLTVEPDTASFLSRLSRSGHTLFARVPPDGYPDRKEPWASSNSRVQCWRLAGWLVDQRDESHPDPDRRRLDVIGVTLASIPNPASRTSAAIVDLWINRVFARALHPDDRDELVEFTAVGANPDTPLDLSVTATQDRLRSLFALMTMAPDFFLR